MELFMPGDLEKLESMKNNYRNTEEEKEVTDNRAYMGCCCGTKYKGEMNMYCEKKFKTALKMIKESVQGEKEDELFYNYLIKEAKSDEEKEIIKSIRDDEIKHNMLFRRIYSDFTGKDVVVSEVEKYDKPKSFTDGVRMALKGELRAMEKYRKIREAMPNRYYRDILFEIMTDEMKHATLYNYILTLGLKKRDD